MAVVDLEAEHAQAGEVEPSSLVSILIGVTGGLSRVPASQCLPARFHLVQHQFPAEFLFPGPPLLPLQVVQHLGGVVPLIDIPAARLPAGSLRFFQQKADSVAEGGMVGGPAQVLPAEQPFRGHRRRSTAGGGFVAIARAVLELHEVQKATRPLKDSRGRLQPRHPPRLQGKQLPAKHREVAFASRAILPSPGAGMLGGVDVAQARLDRLPKSWGGLEHEQFGQCHGGLRVGVERGVLPLLLRVVKVARLLASPFLHRQQPLDPLGHLAGVVPHGGGVAGTQKTEQCERGGTGVGVQAARVGIAAVE